MAVYQPSLRVLRSRRTRASNRVRSLISCCLTNAAPHTLPNGLPSWWPFWSDALVTEVREVCREARLLQDAERTSEGQGVL